LKEFWNVNGITEDGTLISKDQKGCMFQLEGLDGSFLSPDQKSLLHNDWRTTLRLSPDEELQIVFRKRVEFSKWVENQLRQSFLSENPYGRRILLDRLSDQVYQMGENEPRLFSQKIIATFWTRETLTDEAFEQKKNQMLSQLSSFGFRARLLRQSDIVKEINCSAQNLKSTENSEPEWPMIKIEAGHLQVEDDYFRALELSKLPESFTEIGMIQSITSLPYPMDICVRLKSLDHRPLVKRLERKRNLLSSQSANKNSPSPELESQMSQIDRMLRSLADRSEYIYKMQMIIGLRLPKELGSFQRKALGVIIRSASQMDFCDFEESTLGTFDGYLECIPSFSGENIKSHTVLGSNAIHFLPFFRPSKGDTKPTVSFQTRYATLYGIDPIDSQLANYNWLVSGTSGSGKSFFVNSLLAQSNSINPNIFIVDIGGSYNKLTRFLGGQVMSLEPGEGFQISPFFLAKSDDPDEERMRRQHILQIFFEMTRLDGQLPSIEIRHLLSECLSELLDNEHLPKHPVSYLIEKLSDIQTPESRRLAMLLNLWKKENYFGQFIDNNKPLELNNKILTFDLKGLTDFEDLSRVVQLIICSSIWAKVRQADKKTFSWIVLDEIAFSLLKVQPQFVDELVSTLRKYFAGAVIVVQDLEKVTSNFAGSSILQNTHSKAILQQRGNPKNYSDILSLNQVDQWAIQSLRREKGSFSDVFLIRDNDRTIIRHVPSELEYWLATTAPEDSQVFAPWMEQSKGSFQNKILDFVSKRKGGTL
jgi:hypothetical protein